MSYTVTVGFDEESRRYFVINSEIAGLRVETATFEEFVEVTKDVAPDLIGHAQGVTIKFEREIVLAA